MTTPAPTTPEALLAHASWMRALAMGLVSDPHEADDVAQDAALAALLHPPPAGSALRPWLGTVVRHLAWRRWRAERRRADREANAGRPEDDEVDHVAALERIDTQRLLLDAVRDLEEPLRTTVVERYFEGRTGAEIARASGVPAGTVRARLKRALDRLRERLDSEHGSRGAWMALVAPLVPHPSKSIAAGGGTLTTTVFAQGIPAMSLVKIALSGALAVLAVLMVWEFSPDDVEPNLARKEPAAAPVLPNLASGELTGSEPAERRTPLLPATGLTESAPVVTYTEAVPVPLDGSLDIRFVDEQGSPLPGVEVFVQPSMWRSHDPQVLAQGLAGANGLATLAVELTGFATTDEEGLAASELELFAQYPGRESHRQSVVVREDRVTHLGNVVLGPGTNVSGRVVVQGGAAVAGARVGAALAEDFELLPPDELDRIARVGSDAFDFLSAVTSRADGSFDLVGLRPGRMRLWANKPGLRFGLSEPVELNPVRASEEVEIVLTEFRLVDRVSGQVVGPDGVGRRARLGRNMRAGKRARGDVVDTDGEGRFSFEVEYLDATYDLSATDSLGEFARVLVRDIHPGDLDVVIAFRRGEPLLVHLHGGDGAPVLGAEISIGINYIRSRAPATSPAPGDYAIEQPSGGFSLSVRAPGFRDLYAGSFDEGTAPLELNLVMERALAVRGVVVAGGAPVANAIVEAFEFDPDASMTVHGLRCPISYFESGQVRTDEDGRFELSADIDGAFVVRARHGDWVDGEVGPLSAATVLQPLELELSRGGTIEGFVRVAPGESAGGLVVAVHRGDGRPRSTRTAADGSYRFEGLMPGDWRVFPLDEE